MSDQDQELREAWLARCIGHPVDPVRKSVEEAGARFRVVCRDGEFSVCIQDLDPDRVNVHIEGGVITKAYNG